MHKLVVTVLMLGLLILVSTNLWGVEPDEIARDFQPGQMEMSDSDSDIAQLFQKELLIKSHRLSRTGQLILKKNKRLANQQLGEDFPEYWKVEKKEYNPGQFYWDVRPLTDQEIKEMTAVYGMDDVFKSSGLMIAGFGAALDEEIAKSGVGIHFDAVFDGRRGAAFPALIFSADTPYPCREPAKNYVYSETIAAARSPLTGKYSMAVFLTGGACMFYEFGSWLQENTSANSETSLESFMIRFANEFQQVVQFHGYEGPADDRQAHASIPDLDLREETEDGSMTINELHVWIDEDAFVRTKTRYVGVMETDGESQDFFIEQEFSDYRNPPGTVLFEPYRQTLRMGGVLTDAQRAELAEAESQLADYEKQLAAMPESERKMMERMVGPQIEQMRSMVNGGAVQFELITTEIIVNPQNQPSLETVLEEDERRRLTRRIQADLDTLGYQPGEPTGELTQQTVVAIVRFEGDQGIPVTGEPSQSLADALEQAVASRN